MTGLVEVISFIVMASYTACSGNPVLHTLSSQSAMNLAKKVKDWRKQRVRQNKIRPIWTRPPDFIVRSTDVGNHALFVRVCKRSVVFLLQFANEAAFVSLCEPISPCANGSLKCFMDLAQWLLVSSRLEFEFFVLTLTRQQYILLYRWQLWQQWILREPWPHSRRQVS